MALKNNYDVIIIGAGPAGIFAALEVTSKSALKVLVVEKGKDIEKDSVQCKPQESVLTVLFVIF